MKEICEIVNKNLLEVGTPIHFIFIDFSEVIGQTGVRPQQVINDSINKYNIYLGICTPKGATNPLTSKEYESGTEEEFMLPAKFY